MFRIVTLLSLSLSLLAISCASSKVILNENYQYTPYDDRSLVIVVKGEPDVNYSGDVEPEFGPGDPTALIRNFFRKQLVIDIMSGTTLKSVEFGTCTSNGYFNRHEVKPGDAESEIAVLVNGGNYSCQSPDPAYVLVLSEIYIGTLLETHYTAPMMGAGGMMMGGGASASKKLTYKAKAFLYDNRAKQFIEYGIIDESASGFFPVITLNEWKNASRIFTDKLFGQTKLLKRAAE